MTDYDHSIGKFTGKGGVEIFYQKWIAASPKCLIVIAHGVGEHSGRYMHIIDHMAGTGVSFYALDHRGHGRSGGKPGHVEDFMEYIHDLKLLVDHARNEYPKAPLILLGHSMGGVIATKYALTHPGDLDALILSAPAYIPAVEIPKWKISLGTFFSKHLPGFTMPSGLPPEGISRDMAVVEAYVSDHLVHDRVSARWFTEFTKTGEECLMRAPELKMPLLVFHGTSDTLVSHAGSQKLYDSASSRDKKIHLFESLYHETMNEIQSERDKVLAVVGTWILSKIKKGKSVMEETKKAVKKTAKKAVKKTVKKAAKKKAVKKTAKKAAKKTAKKAVKKTAKKAKKK